MSVWRNWTVYYYLWNYLFITVAMINLHSNRNVYVELVWNPKPLFYKRQTAVYPIVETMSLSSAVNIVTDVYYW